MLNEFCREVYLTKLIVLKFGGASVADVTRFAMISDIIIERQKIYDQIVVVVSAMGEMTENLLELCQKVHKNPPRREQDMLVSVGERISISLLAMALDAKGVKAVSFTGSQSGIITSDQHSDARILRIHPYRIGPALENGRVVIVAGFQGMSEAKEITTLGRGGSDTTAVALAAVLKAEKVEFYKDVAGIYSEDPKKVPQEEPYKHLSYDKAFEIAKNGAQVLHPRCVLLAKNNAIPLHILSFLQPNPQFGTRIEDENLARPNHPVFETQASEYTLSSSC